MINAAETHSEYVILLASPLQQWLHERALLLRCVYFACLVVMCKRSLAYKPFTDEAQTTLFKDPVRTAL